MCICVAQKISQGIWQLDDAKLEIQAHKHNRTIMMITAILQMHSLLLSQNKYLKDKAAWEAISLSPNQRWNSFFFSEMTDFIHISKENTV